MIPKNVITEWRDRAPWILDRQVASGRPLEEALRTRRPPTGFLGSRMQATIGIFVRSPMSGTRSRSRSGAGDSSTLRLPGAVPTRAPQR